MLDAKFECNTKVPLVPISVLDAKLARRVYCFRVKRFNQWFDRLDEPFRFVLFMVLCIPAFMAILAGHPLIACGWFVVLGIVRKFPL